MNKINIKEGFTHTHSKKNCIFTSHPEAIKILEQSCKFIFQEPEELHEHCQAHEIILWNAVNYIGSEALGILPNKQHLVTTPNSN